MRELLAALLFVAMLTLGAGAARVGAAAPAVMSEDVRGRSSTTTLLPSPCPQGRLPDNGVCVHLPDEGEGAPAAESAVSSHRDRRGDWVVYDEIPRRPDRSAEYDAYRYPVPCPPGCVFSGYDLDRSDALQRRGRHLRQTGHGGVDITATRGTPVVLVPLDHQEHEAELVYVGPLFGITVITRHTVREAGRLRDYIVVYGHLEAPAPKLVDGSAVAVGARLKAGDVIGFVGDTGSTGLVHLHLEIRRVRDGVDV